MAEAGFDETDFAILRELAVGGEPYFRSDRVSLEEVARRIGVHRSTVAARLDKWRRSGVLQGFTLDVDPSALGLVGAHVRFHARANLDRALPLAVLVEGVSLAFRLDGGWVALVLMSDSAGALDRTLALLARLLEADEALVAGDTRADYPDARTVDLTGTDARILTALLADGRRSPRDVAAATGLAPRTVERRLERLRTEEVLFVVPQVDASLIEGASTALLSYRLAEPASPEMVRGILAAAPRHYVRQVEGRWHGHMGIYGCNAAEVARMAEAVARLEGVAWASARPILGTVPSPHFPQWLAERIARHAGSM